MLNELTVVWGQGLCCVLRGGGLQREENKSLETCCRVRTSAEEGGLTSVGAGLLDSMVCGCASDISDSFSSSSSWMGEDGDLKVLEGARDKL